MGIKPPHPITTWALVDRAARYFFCFLLSLTGFHGFGQSYFYSENRLTADRNQPLYYFILLTVQTDGSASARIRYTDPASGQDKLVEQGFTDSVAAADQDSARDIKYLYASEQPMFLVGDDDSNFVVPRFVFGREGDSNFSYYSPRRVEYKAAGKNWNAATTVVEQQKNFSDLAREQNLVSRFYGKEDIFYKYLYTPDSRALTRLERTARLWVIAVANTNDPKIGITTKKDLAKITETFTTLKERLGINLVMQEVSGSNFSKAAVETALSRIRPSPIDIVIFYYSGHGFRYSNDTSKYPRISLRANPDLDIDKNNLLIEDIYKRILRKGARVTVVMSDCCNENIGAPQPVGKDVIHTRSAPDARLNIDHCKALFFPDHPIAVLTSAAEKNQLAVGNPELGGFFTNFVQAELLKSLYGMDGASLWGVILKNAKDKTTQQALTAPCNNARCIQRAEISVVPAL